jgi:hypothetical protein
MERAPVHLGPQQPTGDLRGEPNGDANTWPVQQTSALGPSDRSDPSRACADERDVAQAVELARALRDQLNEMTRQLAWIERHDVTGRNARAYAMRIEAAALRRDTNEAQILIDRLQRRYVNSRTPRKISP